MTIPDGPGTSREGGLVGRRLGGYQLEALLGTGGMAEVYRAREVALDREVAVKVLPAALASDPDYVRRFRTEAQRFAALEHPHVVPVYSFDDRGPLLYLVMPILKESLRDRLEREGRLDPDEAVRIAGEVASALEMAHAQGLVHRDVKPENVLLDEAGSALLTDFGIARRVTFARQGGAQTLSGTGLPVGTPEYMAPEQLRNDVVDQRADIYALGAVLYELVSGVPPHAAESPYEVAALVLTAPLTPPSARDPRIWPALERVILTALAQRPADRYADAAGFAAALRGALAAPRGASAMGGAVAARGYVTRRLSRPLDLADDVEIDKVPTLPAITIVRPPASARALASLRRQRAVSIAAVALLAVTALGGGALFLAGGFGPAGGGVRTISLPGNTSVVTATADASATAAALATAGAQGAPGAQPTVRSQPTVTPLPGAPLTMTNIALFKSGKNTCKGTQDIRNNSSSRAVGWHWTSAPSGLAWSLYPDSTASQTGVPYDTALDAGQADTVYVNVACGTYSVTVADSLGTTYPAVTMHYP